MKRLLVLLALSAVVAISACDDPNPAEPEVGDVMMEEPVAPSVADAAAPAADTAAPTTPPLDSSALPSEKKTSEESVQPESETLFY